jgi:prophage DNA circulation protein
MDWTSADAADAERGRLTELLGTRQLAAAAAVPDALLAAYQPLASMALRDLTLRAKQLPQLSTCARPKAPGALTPAYRLYQDATRGCRPERTRGNYSLA